MHDARKSIGKISLSRRTTQRMYRWVALSFFAACATVSSAVAQDNGSLPAIHVEDGQVFIPTIVLAKITFSEFSYLANFKVFWDEYHKVNQLTTRDFHLFVDGKEQKVDSANLASVPRRLYRDNAGIENKATHRPNSTWTNLDNLDHRIVNPPDYSGPVSESQSEPFYMIAYRPASFLNGSCHNIRITIGPQDDSGSKRIPVAIDEGYQRTFTQVVPRKQLILRFQTQYCDVNDAATDPFYKTPASEKLEGAAAEVSTKEAGFFLSAFERLDESQQSRIHVALDFPALSGQTGIPSFQVSLLGIFKRTDDGREFRFSDSMENGCFKPNQSSENFETLHSCGRHSFYNHYETEEELPPGDYNLRVAIDFGGTLRRAEVPVTVHTPEKRVAVSGIALCNRYFAHIDIQRIVSSDQARVLAQPTEPEEILQYYGQRKDVQHVLPFTLTPLVSKRIEFTPTGIMRFKKKDSLVAYFEVYDPPLADGGSGHVQFEMCIVDAKTGEVKSNTGFRPADGYVNPGKAVIPISQQVAIGKLSLGEYQVQVRAKDSSGVTTGWRSTSFTRE